MTEFLERTHKLRIIIMQSSEVHSKRIQSPVVTRNYKRKKLMMYMLGSFI